MARKSASERFARRRDGREPIGSRSISEMGVGLIEVVQESFVIDQ